MNIKNIKELIEIRSYIVSVVESHTVNKKDAYRALDLVPHLDKKIMEFILSDNFKSSLDISE